MNILTAMIAVMKVTSDLADTLNSTGNVAAATLIRATVSVVSTRLIDQEVPCDWEKVKDALDLETTKTKSCRPESQMSPPWPVMSRGWRQGCLTPTMSR